MKIITVLGARPQFIKASAVSTIFQAKSEFEEILVHNGQHYDDNMSKVFFDELEIPRPKYNLGVGGGGHGQQTGAMLAKIETVLLEEKPDLLMVYGDTNSTLAGALAAVKLHIPVAHVEVGLRSFSRRMPEEINRVLTDHSSDVLFTPTMAASKNLQDEGIDEDKIFHVGDVMFDSTQYFGMKAENQSNILTILKLNPKKYVLCTVHRAENTDNLARLKDIFNSIEKLAKEYKVIFPVHPRTRKGLEAIGFSEVNSKIGFIDPVGYLDMIMLKKNSRIILTDSGGVQKEAYFHKIPCITLKDETEWTELVENGWNVLANPQNLLEVFHRALDIEVADRNAIYGNGDASEKIIQTLLENQGIKEP